MDHPRPASPPPGVRLAAEADRLHHAVEHLAGIDLDHIIAALDTERLEAVRRIMQISASAAGDAAPTVSASNCMNWRKRPGPGFSLWNTHPAR